MRNVWSVAQESIVEDLARREAERIAQEQLARELEDRQREIARQATADQRAATAFDTQQEALAYAKSRRPVEEQAGELEMQLNTADRMSSIGTRTEAAERAAALAARQAKEDAALEAARQRLLSSAPGTPEYTRAYDEVDLLEGREPTDRGLPRGGRTMTAGELADIRRREAAQAALPPEVRKMIMGLAGRPGMTHDKLLRATTLAASQLVEQYPDLDPIALNRMASALIPRPQREPADPFAGLTDDDEATDEAAYTDEDLIGMLGLGAGDSGAEAPAAAAAVPAAAANVQDPYLRQAIQEWVENEPGDIDQEAVAKRAAQLRVEGRRENFRRQQTQRDTTLTGLLGRSPRATRHSTPRDVRGTMVLSREDLMPTRTGR